MNKFKVVAKEIIIIKIKNRQLTGVDEDSINVDFGTHRTQDEATGWAKH